MSVSDVAEAPESVQELGHPGSPLTRRILFGTEGMGDDQFLEGMNFDGPGELDHDQEFSVDEECATASSSCGDLGDDSALEAIAAEAPEELFSASGSMREFANRFPAGASRSIPLKYLVEVEENIGLPPTSRLYSTLRDVRQLLHDTDQELGQSWDSERKETLSGLMVIDCHSRRVVPADPGCDYVALSYVWGSITSGGESEKFQEDLHGRRLPLTIRDAMNVVSVLGKKYLWVDRYCINGSEPGTKHYMISNMDAIYESAYLTIIAASGSNGDHGLPNVSKSCQPLDENSLPAWDGIVYAKVPDFGLEQIKTCTWSTRGWTYQEGLLSRRRLIFTDDCAIVHYRGEDKVRASSGIFAHINEYSRRSLTYPTDLLNAFLGVFRAYERLQPPAMHVWGVPFLLGSDWNIRQPGYGLLWRYHGRSLQRLQRLKGLPSWTWAGWTGWSANKPVDWYLQLLSPPGPYSWLVSCAHPLRQTRVWGPSDISIDLMVGDQLIDVSDHFRTTYRLQSGNPEDPAPVLYVTAWSTTVTAFLSPNLDIYLPGRDMESSIVTLDQTIECMYKGEPKMYGHWGCQWTAVVICWVATKGYDRSLRSQSLLLERAEGETFRRVGVLETDWHKSDLDEDGCIPASGRTFTQTCLPIV